jgi:ubiquinone biosynthesis protein
VAVLAAEFDRLSRRGPAFEVLLARRTRQAFERLGPTFVKAGQLISSSAGSLPKAWVDEMSHCRDQVPAAPWASVAKLLKDELGERRRELLDLDPVALAAGSMAQVHAAALSDGTAVVVKAQRPGLEKVLDRDIRLLRLSARFCVRFSPACAAANLVALVDDFALDLHEQLSFLNEAANAARIGSALRPLLVRIPHVYAHLSTDRVLVMERLWGVAGDDTGAISALGVDQLEIVRALVAALILPAVRDGVFHGDMHPGNLLVLPNGRLGLLDFGVIGRLDAAKRAATSDLLDAIVNRRYGDAALAILQMIEPGEVDVAALIADTQSLLTAHLETALGKVDVNGVIIEFLHSAARNGLVLPRSLMSFLKQLLYIEGICRMLAPDFDVLSDAAPIVSLARGTAERTIGQVVLAA